MNHDSKKPMISFLFVTGPPFDTPLWDFVVERTRGLGFSAHAIEMLSNGDGSVEVEVNRLAEQILASNDPVVLVAHGTAIPAAIAATRKVQPAGLVLSNGPIIRADRFTRLLIRWAKLPSVVTQSVLSPRRTIQLLASSVGLRRMVVNPYVMDRDTTVAVCGPIIESKTRFPRMRNYLIDLSNFKHDGLPPYLPTLLCYGDSDPLSIRNIDSFLAENQANIQVNAVPGGRYLHPIERPWELADRCVEWVKNSITTT